MRLPTLIRLSSLAALLASLAGCPFNPTLPSGGIACGARGECPAPLACDQAVKLCCQRGQCGRGDAAAPDTAQATCNVFGENSCGAGRTCRPLRCLDRDQFSVGCAPAGTAQRGQLCPDSNDQCSPGHLCTTFNCAPTGSDVRICTKLCTSDLDCPEGGACTGLSCGGERSKTLKTCTNPCDPREASPSTCAAGTACHLLSGDRTDCLCAQSGTVDEGGACAPVASQCKRGLICTVENGTGACRPICRLDEPATCGVGRRCVEVNGYSRYGGCAPGAPPPVTGCDPTVASACGPGQVCRVGCTGVGLATATCTASQGTKRAGELCVSEDDCAGSLKCVGKACADGSRVNHCEQVCKTDADCGGRALCLGLGCGAEAAPVGICWRNCDPLGAATGGCPAGLVCVARSGDRTDCVCRKGATTSPEGAPCADDSACQPGHLCVQRGATFACRPLCRVLGNDCAAGRTCVTLPDHVTYGACVPTAADTPPACDPAVATSCPTPGQACYFGCDTVNMRSTVSCGPAGAVPVGGKCTLPSDCAPGAECTSSTCADGTRIGTCAKHCRIDEDCEGGSARCSRNACAGKPIPYGRCTVSCDPRGAATGECAEGLHCFLAAHGTTDCVCRTASQTGADGAACLSNFACQPGLTCAMEGDKRLCRPLCRLDSPTCPGGRRCTPISDQRIYGACAP